MDKLVSIIIPCFNQSHFLPSAVESCLQQTYANIEIIVIDDGSHHNVAETLKPFSHKVNLIVQKNMGLSAARNTGIDNCHGEFLQLLDADDLLEKDTIEVQVKFLRENPVVKISVCRNKLFAELDEDGQPHLTGEWRMYHKALDAHLCYFNIAPPHAFLTRREVIGSVGLFDVQLKACEDYDFWLRAASMGFIPHYNGAGMVYYRKHNQSMSANIKNQTNHDALMHLRLASILNDCPEFPSGRRLEGLLAFAAGALATAAKLLNLNLEGSIGLLELVKKHLDNAENLLSKADSDWNDLSALFYLRIISTLSNSDLNTLPATGNPLGEIKERVSVLWGIQSKLSLFRMMVLNLFKNKNNYIYENKEIRHHLIRYIFDPRF